MRQRGGWTRSISESFLLALLACGVGATAAKAAKAAPNAQPEIAPLRAVQPSKTKAASETSIRGKRDPFALPKTPSPGSLQDPPDSLRPSLPPGKKGLIIGQLRLEGIVQQKDGTIAVVTNRSNRAYFLRVHDQLYDGFVARITDHSIVFRESGRDGRRDTGREVVKRLGSSPGEY